MIARLDKTSRTTIIRFALKAAIAVTIGVLTQEHRIMATASWMLLYAIFSAMTGVLAKEKLGGDSFNYWDEMIWLLLVAATLRMLSGTA